MAMGGNQLLSTLLFFLFLSELVQILHACNCTYPPNYPPKHPKHPPKHPPKHHHPTPKPVTPRPPHVHPPTPPYVHPPTPPFHPPTPPLHPPTPPFHPPTPPLHPPTPPFHPPTPPFHPPTPPYVCPPTPPSPTPTPPSPIPTPPTPRPPSPTPPSPTPTPPSPIPTPPTPRPPSPRPPSPSPPMCPIDVLKLGACVDLLGGLIHIGVGSQAKSKCCPLIQGLADLDAALCLCTTIRAKLLNLNIYLPLALELLITCGKHPPPGYQCPPLPPLPSPLL